MFSSGWGRMWAHVYTRGRAEVGSGGAHGVPPLGALAQDPRHSGRPVSREPRPASQVCARSPESKRNVQLAVLGSQDTGLSLAPLHPALCRLALSCPHQREGRGSSLGRELLGRVSQCLITRVTRGDPEGKPGLTTNHGRAGVADPRYTLVTASERLTLVVRTLPGGLCTQSHLQHQAWQQLSAMGLGWTRPFP